MQHGTLMDEDIPARIEAVFADRNAATAAVTALCQRFEFDKEQFSIVSPDELPDAAHRNRFAFSASGRRLQKRQLAATLIAFTLIIVGLLTLHFIGDSTLPPGLSAIIMAGLIIAAVAITANGMLSWRPSRIETRHRYREGETALVVHVHDVSEQYSLRDALIQMGARVKCVTSAGVS
jgi:hypothetical protein